MYRYSLAGRTPRNCSEANMNGRRYRLASSWPGTHSRSTASSSRMESRNHCSGRCGMAMRSAERFMRRALASARNRPMPPSG